jgi:ABC-type nitrate/sulfonate/bicarbonate transport system substrate-binding protein
LKPEKAWRDAAGGEFRVELVIADDPFHVLESYASGAVHAMWSTVDLLPRHVHRLGGDARTLPRVIQQVSWSNGADGIVARSAVKSIADLRGKTIAVAQLAPTHFLTLALLDDNKLTAKDVELKLTHDAVSALGIYESEDRLDAAAGWQPQLDKLAKVAGNHVLATTADRELIAHVWIARADFAAKHPAIVKGLAAGIAAAAADLPKAKPGELAKLAAQAFGVPVEDATEMIAKDARLVTAKQSHAFLVDGGFAALYARAAKLYDITGAGSAETLVDASLVAR